MVVGAAPDPSQRAEVGVLEDKGAALDLTQRAKMGALEDEHMPDVQQASRLVGSVTRKSAYQTGTGSKSKRLQKGSARMR